jgi:hypothetical protein
MQRPRLRFRRLPPRGSYPAWLRALRGRSGVYVFRAAATRRPLLVGRSSSGRLYQALTRHLQAWSGETAGAVYARGDVELAVAIVAPELAAAAAAELVARLRPRDNARDVAAAEYAVACREAGTELAAVDFRRRATA